MSEKVVTTVTAIIVNEVDEDESERLKGKYGVDSLSDVAESMEPVVENKLQTRVFAEADDIPLFDVTTEVQSEDVDDEQIEAVSTE